MAVPIEYRSTDGSAPVVTGVAGSLIALLDAILVNGYGAKAAAGWTKPYTGTNLAAFKNGGNGHYLRIDDTATQMGRCTLYESMTAVSTGLYPTPTTAVFSGGLYMRKSITADATARPWICWASAKHFLLIIKSSITTLVASAGDSQLMVGELSNTQCGPRYDKLNTFIIGGASSSTSAVTEDFNTRCPVSAINIAVSGHYLLFTHTGITPSQAFYKNSLQFLGPNVQTSGFATGGATYPEPVSGALLVDQIYANEVDDPATRGIVPGIWAIAHVYSAFTSFDTFSGTGTLAGKTFTLVHGGLTSAFAVETSGGW